MPGHNDIIPNDIVDIILFIRYNSSIETCYGIPVLSAEVELMKYTMTVKEAAGIWNVSERRVAYLCKEGRIDGAEKKGRSWQIPADAEKPADNRVRSGMYRKTEPEDKLPLPVGVSNYREAVQSYYYVDKTLLIEQVIESGSEVTLFTRPRCFGKSLNMRMLKNFLEVGTDKSLFDGLYISKNEKLCEKYMGKYPVISISLKGVDADSYSKAKAQIVKIINKEARRYRFMLESE